MKGNILETLIAFPSSLIIECPSIQYPNRIEIRGIGSVERKEDCKIISEQGSFILTVWDNGAFTGADQFQIVITVDAKLELNHDSGLVSVRNSDLIIRNCTGTV
jgi:hypothetical protein